MKSRVKQTEDHLSYTVLRCVSSYISLIKIKTNISKYIEGRFHFFVIREDHLSYTVLRCVSSYIFLIIIKTNISKYII